MTLNQVRIRGILTKILSYDLFIEKYALASYIEEKGIRTKQFVPISLDGFDETTRDEISQWIGANKDKEVIIEGEIKSVGRNICIKVEKINSTPD